MLGRNEACAGLAVGQLVLNFFEYQKSICFASTPGAGRSVYTLSFFRTNKRIQPARLEHYLDATFWTPISMHD
ncbi:hypothetical protein COCSADRAFT_242032 [Bipolaris sorokiniana ND90Pr]|uniref:Uncharacterized protein n=1 Tax=Cochliobolus sativus (strain ND90Pr / ATCC 201652) TaxID=665912 RepID=M2QZ91_COCSN|nr:uncharacterized protein COCSADRAFT_242032 [Bipolaris sorokiniana ND90Pr]EMD60364.1 hypothetical protein COCSADRAFT_242032 [Bipolaris sorokiniana ND90Pr]